MRRQVSWLMGAAGAVLWRTLPAALAPGLPGLPVARINWALATHIQLRGQPGHCRRLPTYPVPFFVPEGNRRWDKKYQIAPPLPSTRSSRAPASTSRRSRANIPAVGHRLSKIYTRTGDDGTTGLADGSRVDKDDVRVEAMGAVDELNSYVGCVLSHEIPTEMREILADVQHALFDIGGEIAIPGSETVTAQYVAALESALDDINATLPPLKEFILPGGGGAAATVHVARAVCRRAERTLLTLSRRDPVNPESRRYLNRLSDLFFVLARALARARGNEVYWDPKRNRD